jgi:hypothetical protein
MKKLSIYTKYNIFRLTLIILVILFIAMDNFIFILFIFILIAIFDHFKCPNCKNRLGRKEDNYIVTPFQGKHCNKCHIDLSSELED